MSPAERPSHQRRAPRALPGPTTAPSPASIDSQHPSIPQHPSIEGAIVSQSPALTVERPSRPAKPKRHTSPTKRKQYLAAYLFLLPFFVVFLTMLVVPLVYSGYLSLFESKLIGGEVFAGLANYARALTRPPVPREPRPRGAVLRHPGADHARPGPVLRPRARHGARPRLERHPAAGLHAVRRARGRRHADVGLPVRRRLRTDRPDRPLRRDSERRTSSRPRTSCAR